MAASLFLRKYHGGKMGSLFHSSMLLMFLFITFCVFLIPAILYILTLQKALLKCAESSRTMQPGMVWLLLVPLFNIVWNFFVVFGIANSLKNEFARKGIPTSEPLPGQPIGLAMSICACCGFIPIFGLLAGIAYLVLWIIYWIKVADFSRRLDESSAVAAITPPMA
jgi:hypothetical protein